MKYKRSILAVFLMSVFPALSGASEETLFLANAGGLNYLRAVKQAFINRGWEVVDESEASITGHISHRGVDATLMILRQGSDLVYTCESTRTVDVKRELSTKTPSVPSPSTTKDFVPEKWIDNLKRDVYVFLLPDKTLAETPLEQEIQEYIRAFSRDPSEVSETAYRELQWAAITDERIYDPISKLLLNQKRFLFINSHFVPLQLKVLAYSGNPKYKPTLRHVYENTTLSTLKNQAAKAWKLLEKHQKWNEEISKGLESVPLERLKQARVIRMLCMADDEVKVVAIRRTRAYFTDDKEVMDTVVQLLQETSAKRHTTIHARNFIRWYCKLIIESGETRFIDRLKNIEKNAKLNGVRQHIQDAIDVLSEIAK